MEKRLVARLGVFFIAFIPIIAKAQTRPTAYPFLNLPSTAHTVAVGGLSISYVDDNAGVAFDNPALYGEESAGRLFLSYMYYMMGAHSANALYGLPINDRGSWAIGLRALQYGKMEGYDINNQATGSFSATDIALSGLFSYELTNRLRGALALKFIYSNIERYNALALAVDAGLSYYNEDKGLSVGASLSNAGATLLSYDKQKPLTAWDLRVGYSQAFMHAPVRLHFTAYGLNPLTIRDVATEKRKTLEKVLRHFTIGAEYFTGKNFWLAMGYNPRLAQDLQVTGGSLFWGLSVGAGFSSNHFRIGIAAARYHPSTLSLMVTFCTTFGNDRYIF